MKKKKIVTLLLTFVMASSILLTSCTNNSGANEEQQPTTIGGEPLSFDETQTTLISAAKSDYKIVIPENASTIENFAAEELQTFLYESTDCKLSIISDSGLVHNNEQKYLSVGNTTLLASQTDIVIDYDVMGEAGPSIDTKGNTVYMAGASDYGTLNSVYKFLNYQIGFKAYAYDCVVYDYYETLNLLDFNYHYVPAIEWLEASDNEMIGREKAVAAARMYMYASGGRGGYSLTGTLFGGLWCHTIYDILPLDRYSSQHPEWFQNDQICYTNEELIAEACNNMITKAVSTNDPFFMIGGADNVGSCNCESCQSAAKIYGTSGVYMRFLNRISDAIETYFIKNDIEKDLLLVALNYYAFLKPPVKDVINGDYTILDESCIPDGEGMVQVACCYTPIDACTTHAMGDDTCKQNKEYTAYLMGWAAITDNLFIYGYGTNFQSFTTHYNTWAFMGEQYQLFEQLDVRFCFEESAGSSISPMVSMRTFIRSQLAWNPYQSTEQLIAEFMENYYGYGGEYVAEYFDRVMEHFQYIYNVAGESCQGCFYAIARNDFWPHAKLREFASLLENAMLAIETTETLTAEQKELYQERVYKEYVLIKLNEYNKYSGYLTPDELAKVKTIVDDARSRYPIA